MTDTQKHVVEALRAFERGEIVVVMDDRGRENEGDLIIAASHCTPEKMAFIVRHTSGIVCAPMTALDAKRLNLPPMVADNDSPHTTAFTISVDYRYGTSTGISADDRTLTVRALANPNAGGGDFVRPGHVFPLIAREGGVLMRSGHTEAAVDLCRLSGLPPVGVLCELVNDDGTVMRGPEVTAFAQKHQLHEVTVADLISYRRRQENLVEHKGETKIVTRSGEAVAHSYQLPWENIQHVAIVMGDIRDGKDVPVRLCRENLLQDVFGQKQEVGGQEVGAILQHMAEKYQRGVIVYLREGSVGVGERQPPRSSYNEGVEDHEQACAREEEWRQIGLGAQILRHLGINSIILLASKERHYVGIEGFGIKIVQTELV